MSNHEPAGGGPDDLDGAAFHTLIDAARTDPSALERLRSVRRVDGHPIDPRTALDGASGPALEARLDELATIGAAGSTQPGLDPAAAQRVAKEILDSGDFHAAPTPRPLESVVNWLGARLQDVLDLIRFPDTSRARGLLGVAILGAIVAAAAIVGWRVSRSSVRRPRPVPFSADLAAADPDDLDRQVQQLCDRGEYTQALRLQFAAGVLRLDRQGRVDYRPSITMGEVRRQADHARFDELADLFEAVRYGGRAADGDDLAASAASWAAVLESLNA